MQSSQIKILHVISGLNDGGAEALLYNLVELNQTNRHYVISLTEGGKYQKLLKKENVEVFTLNMQRHINLFLMLLRLRELIKVISPDVVQSWMYHANILAGIVAKSLKVKCIIWSIHADKYSTLKFKTKLVVFIGGLLSHFLPSKIVYSSKYSLIRHSAALYPKRIGVVINNGVNTNKFIFNENNKLKKEILIPDNVLLLGCVARWDAHKDHKTIIRAASKLNAIGLEYRFLLLGDGINNENQALCKMLKEQNVEENFILLGMREDIPEIMSALDIHILSSISESFGNVVAEAMSCETVCIVTDIGMPADIVGIYGGVFKVGDFRNLAKTIEKFYKEKTENRIQWNNRRKGGRARIEEKFSIEIMMNKYSKLWESCLDL